MGFFPDVTIARLRQQSDANRPHRADVERMTVARQPGGVMGKTYQLTETLDCRAARLSPDEVSREAAEQVIDGAAWRVVFAAGEDVRVGDRLSIRGTTPSGGFSRTLDVVSVDDVQAQRSSLRTVCVSAAGEPAGTVITSATGSVAAPVVGG